MKRQIICTLIAAFVIGVAGNAFAAANPFKDVPSDHWSYDALTQLSQDGVIKGFGDGTFRGYRRTSRYEMAQLVAALMARTDLTAMQKIIVERLAAEYKVELDLLGVRVSNLEKYADRVKWNGTARFRYKNRLEQDETRMERKKLLYLTLRLEPTMEINEHWKAKARIDGHIDMKKDLFTTETNRYSTEANQTIATQGMPTSGIKRAYIEGNYDNFQILLGKIPYKTITDGGMIHDEAISGAQITFGNKVKATLTAGRSRHFDSVVEQDAQLPITGTYYGAEIYND